LDGRQPNGIYLAIIAVALVVTVYCAVLMTGFAFKLLFIAAAVALGVSAWRAWRASSSGRGLRRTTS
jgi:hypothetical protein